MSGDAAKPYGSWLLRSFQIEIVETGARSDAYGPDPRGVLILLPHGRMAAIITPRDQPMPDTDAGRAALYRQLLAYSGRYRLEPPDKFVTTVDVAWFPGWVGTEQPRSYRLDGDRLEIVSAPGRDPRMGDALVRGILTWRREGGG